ncbi:ABC transporter ATP-binding protein [Bartonella sp. LJL80]
MTSRLYAKNLEVHYGPQEIFKNLSVTIPDGSFTAIIGPNGCGKSTLLRTLSRLLKPQSGQVVLDGRSISVQPSIEVAKTLGLLPQRSMAPEGISVRALVERGRFPYQSFFRQWSEEDENAVNRALDDANISNLAARSINELSGGQSQRVWIAMVLAQDTPLLLLDEPTTFLDLAHQIELMDLFSKLNKKGRTVVAVLHDLNQASRYTNHIIAMREGKIEASGKPANIITADLIKRVFALDATIMEDPVSSSPLVIPGLVKASKTGKQAS